MVTLLLRNIVVLGPKLRERRPKSIQVVLEGHNLKPSFSSNEYSMYLFTCSVTWSSRPEITRDF